MFGTNVEFLGWPIVWIYLWLNQIQAAASRHLGKFRMNMPISGMRYVIIRAAL